MKSVIFHNSDFATIKNQSAVRVSLLLLPWLVLVFYLASFFHYLSYFKVKSALVAARIRILLSAAVVVHSTYLLLLSLRLNHLPVGNLYQVLTTLAWLSVLVYFFLEIRLKEMTMGVFFIPVIFGLQAISTLFLDMDKPLAEILTTRIFEVHVVVLIAAYTSFAISFIASIMYILLSREIQSRKLGIFFERLPSLEFFDRLSNHAINIGLVLASVGISLGIYMGLNVWEGSWFTDPKFLTVLVAWGIYVVHFFSRKIIGWQGRRAAIVSVIGFNWLLFSFIIVSLFFSRFHNFH